MAGPGAVSVRDSRDGWPGLVDVQLGTAVLRVALHVGPIGLSHRNRDTVERRFQNPAGGKPVTDLGGSLPVLLGLWEEGTRPVFAVLDARPRLGRTTRQSLFIPLWQLEEAARTGWAEHHNANGELVLAFHPVLLPSYLEILRADAYIPAEQISAAVDAAGLNTPVDESLEQRARRAATHLVRNAAFSRRVLSAYNGLCALCGLNFGLVQGAHIYPAHALGSPDTTANGIALCGNHHAAFDRHLIWIDPGTRRVVLHPELHARRAVSIGSAQFVDSTFSTLAEPNLREDRPRSEMFVRRYGLHPDKYNWGN
ncbi:MAG TPA: HNH endonuclease [Longimicrobium sp.]|uniref:HNH endonuclease n=1 Tax=Longimicrobium sp. TaxID=2029185 RepID=UPI002ED91C8A